MTGLMSASSARAPSAAAATASFQRKRAPLSSAIEATSIASMIAVPAAANAYQRRKANIANKRQRQRKRDAARHRRDKRVMSLGQRHEASEALGQAQRADDKHQPADVGHAARRDRHRGREGCEDGGDGQREVALALIRPCGPPSPT